MDKVWNYEDEWFEESNVSFRLKSFLESRDYIIKKFNADKTMKGYDIVAEKDGKEFVVEVKGYPSDKYVRGKKKGKDKPTSPKLQAKHWFAEALLSLLKAKSASPQSVIVMGLPDMPQYRDLISKTNVLKEKISIIYFLVNKEGSVDEL